VDCEKVIKPPDSRKKGSRYIMQKQAIRTGNSIKEEQDMSKREILG
jgi:hypothetical protein